MPNQVTLTLVDGKQMLVCDCGAKAFHSEYKRFNSRHPRICNERKVFAKQLAGGTRCVDSEERYGERWGR